MLALAGAPHKSSAKYAGAPAGLDSCMLAPQDMELLGIQLLQENNIEYDSSLPEQDFTKNSLLLMENPP